MRKHWVALLSVLGLTGSVVQMESQVLKGSKPPATNETVKPGSTAQKTANSGKLQVNQQTLRQQNPSGTASNKPSGAKAVGQNTGTCRYSEGCQTQNKQAITKGNQQITKGNQQITKGNQQLTPPPPGQAGANSQLTKGNQQITKGNQQITKGNAATVNATDKSAGQLTKGNQQITKGNQQITKGNQQITKGNQQITKGNQQITK